MILLNEKINKIYNKMNKKNILFPYLENNVDFNSFCYITVRSLKITETHASAKESMLRPKWLRTGSRSSSSRTTIAATKNSSSTRLSSARNASKHTSNSTRNSTNSGTKTSSKRKKKMHRLFPNLRNVTQLRSRATDKFSEISYL